MRARQLLCGLLLFAAPYRASAQTQPNPVIHWANIVQQSIHNAAAPRSAGTSEILHTMVHLAVYDAVVAIDGTAEPFAAQIPRSASADIKAAVATAAYATARARVAPSQRAFLEQEYQRYLAEIPAGWPKAEGVRIGWLSASTMLKLRANDNFDKVVTYSCITTPPPVGRFEPDSGCPASPTSPQPVDVKVGQIKPYVLEFRQFFRPPPPYALTSEEYATDFNEVRDFGRDTSTFRTAEQTDVAFFWAENPYVHWNRNLVRLALAYNLDASDTARLFAMVHTSVSDAIIIGFEAKYDYALWRPRTSIPRAEEDNNPLTAPDATWKPLLSVNHPEYPSGHGFWSGALLYAVQSFFQSADVNWTLETSKAAVPRVEKTQRSFTSLYTLETQIQNARVWGGLHYRSSIDMGELIGDGIALVVLSSHFGRIP